MGSSSSLAGENPVRVVARKPVAGWRLGLEMGRVKASVESHGGGTPAPGSSAPHRYSPNGAMRARPMTSPKPSQRRPGWCRSPTNPANTRHQPRKACPTSATFPPGQDLPCKRRCVHRRAAFNAPRAPAPGLAPRRASVNPRRFRPGSGTGWSGLFPASRRWWRRSPRWPSSAGPARPARR